jgi:hypothetical protein
MTFTIDVMHLLPAPFVLAPTPSTLEAARALATTPPPTRLGGPHPARLTLTEGLPAGAVFPVLPQ